MQFTVKPSEAAKRRCCSRACAAQEAIASGRLAGPNSPAWRGGYEPYYGPSWHAAKRAVRRRDKVCQRCGITPEQNGRALDVHHLVPFRAFGAANHAAANALTNLAAFCPTCHLLTEWEAERAQAVTKAPADAWPVRGPVIPKPPRYCVQCASPLKPSQPSTARYCSHACAMQGRYHPVAS